MNSLSKNNHKEIEKKVYDSNIEISDLTMLARLVNATICYCQLERAKNLTLLLEQKDPK